MGAAKDFATNPEALWPLYLQSCRSKGTFNFEHLISDEMAQAVYTKIE